MTNRYQGVDQILTNVSLAYPSPEYVAEQIFPSVPVAKQSGKHFVYDRGRFRLNNADRSAGSNSNEVTLSLTTSTPYMADDHALRQFVTDEDVDNAVEGTDPFVDATENTTDMLNSAREIELAAMLTNTSILTQNTTLSGTAQWNDYTNSDPFADVETARTTIYSNSGVNPNTLILGRQVYDKLKHHPKVLARIQYVSMGVITPEILASVFEVDKVIIAGAMKNTATEGQADSMSYIWGKNAVLAYIAPRVGIKIMTLGITYAWKSRKVERLRGSNEEDRKGTYVRVGDHYYEQRLVSVAAGYLIKNTVA